MYLFAHCHLVGPPLFPFVKPCIYGRDWIDFGHTIEKFGVHGPLGDKAAEGSHGFVDPTQPAQADRSPELKLVRARRLDRGIEVGDCVRCPVVVDRRVTTIHLLIGLVDQDQSTHLTERIFVVADPWFVVLFAIAAASIAVQGQSGSNDPIVGFVVGVSTASITAVAVMYFSIRGLSRSASDTHESGE